MLIFFFCFYLLTLLFFFFFKNKINSIHYCYLNIFSLSGIWLLYTINLIYYIPLDSNLHLTFNNFNLFSSIIENNIGLNLSFLNFFFSYLVLTIGLTTNIYILTYFKWEANESFFIFWINFFVFSMLILVLSSNFFTLFLGWELIGFTSFFLINFWHTKRSTLKSSFKAFSFNLISDVFLMASLVIFYSITNTSDIDTFLNLFKLQNNNTLLKYGVFSLILCASIKSVQIIGHLWLPDSMEAPVPASALIHSATLVSAGIYLLCKFNVIIAYFNFEQILIGLGATTAAYGGVTASFQSDKKKLLAYSTMSHCGFMWVLASLNNVYVTIIYLYLHGIFKAATFYCAGSFIRIYNTQDTRWMGLGATYTRLDTLLLLICSANLAGLPFTVGFIYKQFFLNLLLSKSVTPLWIGFLFIGMLSGLVYFFKLSFYSTYDFYKNIKFLSLTSLLINKNVTGNKIKIINVNHLIATTLLILFSFIVTFIFLKLFPVWSLTTDINLNLSITELLMCKITILYQNYYIFFYVLYFIIFLFLLFISWRNNIFYIEANILFILLLLTILLICGAILWPKLVR